MKTADPTTATTLDGYVRVSRKGGREGERFISPDEQRRAITTWAETHGVRIARWFEDIDKSGGTMARKGLTQALARIESGESGGIVVARLDRFARNVAGGLAAIERVHELGGRVVAVHDNVDPATASGKMMLTILLAVAAWQRETARENFEVALENSAARGLFAIRPQYGYRKGDDGRVEIDPVTSRVVVRIFEARAAGVGWRKLCRDLTTDGIPTPTGKALWAPTTLAGIVQSETPLGIWNGPFGIRLEEAWPAIVEPELWARANAVVGKRDDARSYQDRTYAGIARCAACRRTLTREVNNSGFVSYKCAQPGCKATSIGVTVLDEHVTAAVDARIAKWRERSRIQAERDDDGTLTQLVKRRDRIVKEFETWRDDTDMRDLLGDDDYREGLRVRAAARDEAEHALAVARAQSNAGPLPYTDDTASVTDMPWEDRRRVVEAVLHAVWVRKSTVRGPGASRRVGERLRIEFADAKIKHELPTPSRRDDLAAVTW